MRAGVQSFVTDSHTKMIPGRLQLFDFELAANADLAFIPLIVRHHLDQLGWRLSLAQWQQLPLAARTELASIGIGQSQAFAAALGTALPAPAFESMERIAPANVMPGASEALPPEVARQCELASVPTPATQRWRALTPLQRYALAKLSRKSQANHDFLPAVTEFGLVDADARS